MRLEERVIEGILHWRYAEDVTGFKDSSENTTEWEPYTLEELSSRVVGLESALVEDD